MPHCPWPKTPLIRHCLQSLVLLLLSSSLLSSLSSLLLLLLILLLLLLLSFLLLLLLLQLLLLLINISFFVFLSTREELVALIAELESESPPGASREMSIDGSRSGTVTPMGLSEAPTPVDSKAPTPVASGRTSPVIDTGQKDDALKKEEKDTKSETVVEKVKERLKVEETEEVQKSDVKDNEVAAKTVDESETKPPSKLIENKDDLKDVKDRSDSVELKADTEKEKETKEVVSKPNLGGEVKEEEKAGLQGEAKKHEDKPLPINKDTVMRERDKAVEKNEVKPKESVWDKLSKQKEEKAAAEKNKKALLDISKGNEEKSDVKAKLNQEPVIDPLKNQKQPVAKPLDAISTFVKPINDKKHEVSNLGEGPRQDKIPPKLEIIPAKESKVSKEDTASGVAEKSLKSFPSSIGAVSITPVQPPQDKVSAHVAKDTKSFIGKLPASTTITATSKQVPVSSPGPVPNAASNPSVLSSASKIGPLSPTSKTGPLSPTSQAGPLSPTSKAGPLSPTSKTGPLSPPPNVGPILPTSKAGPLSPAAKPATVSVTPVSVSKSGQISPTNKSGPLSPNSVPTPKSGSLSITSVPPVKAGPLSPSTSLSRGSSNISTVLRQGKDGPLSPSASVPGKVGGPSGVDKKELGQVEISAVSKEPAKLDLNVVPSAKAPVVVSTTSQSPVSSAVVSALPSVQPNKIPPTSSDNSSPSPASTKSTISPSERSSSKEVLTKVPVAASAQKESSSDKSITPFDTIPPFPPIPTKGFQPAVPKDVPAPTSVLTLKRIPSVTPAAAAEAIPPSNIRAPPVDSIAHLPPNEAITDVNIPPFPPAPGIFPSVRELTSSDVPKAPVDSVKKDKSVKYFKPPSSLPSGNTFIPTSDGPSLCKAPPLESDKTPSGPPVSTEPFPEISLSGRPAAVSNISKPPASSTGFTKGSSAASSTVSSSLKLKPNPVIPPQSPSRAAPSLSKDAGAPEPPQKKAKIEEDKKIESQNESLKETSVISGRIMNPLKRSLVTSPSEKKEVGGPQEAKVLRKEGTTSGNKEEDSKHKKTEDSMGKTLSLVRNPPQAKEDSSKIGSLKPPSSNIQKVQSTGIGSQPVGSVEKDKITSVKSTPELKKPTSEPPRRLLKLNNFSRDLAKPQISQPAETKAGTPASDKKESAEKSEKKNPDVGEAIEEPVMIVKGEGEGAKCESGNDLHYVDEDFRSDHPSKPWWECFDNVSNSCNVEHNVEGCETIEECVMYFWGDGNGVDCEAGNNGDETEANAETKQGDGGSSTLVATDTRGNSTSGEVKPQKDKETGRTDNDVKEVDGIAGVSDEAKVNGLRTLEGVEKTEKTLSQREKTEPVVDEKHSGVNGKKSKEDNDVSNDKSNVNKNSKLGEGKNTKDKADNENCESLVNKSVADKEETKVQRRSSRNKDDDKNTTELDESNKSSKELDDNKSESRRLCAKRGTRNRASLEEVKDMSEESEEEDSVKDEENVVKKKRGRPKGTTVASRRKTRGTRGSTQRGSDAEEEKENENENEEEEEDNQEEPTKKRRQRGKGSTARPLPDGKYSCFTENYVFILVNAFRTLLPLIIYFLLKSSIFSGSETLGYN